MFLIKAYIGLSVKTSQTHQHLTNCFLFFVFKMQIGLVQCRTFWKSCIFCFYLQKDCYIFYCLKHLHCDTRICVFLKTKLIHIHLSPVFYIYTGVCQMIMITIGGAVNMYLPCGLYTPSKPKPKPPNFYKNMIIIGGCR